MLNPIIKVNQGELRGVIEKNINDKIFVAFRGIPYAKPPIGNLRFKDCEEVDSWFGVRDATTFSDPCAQQDWRTLEILGSDDCLYLNIYTTNLNSPLSKAVMVWIHGGSFTCGSGDDSFYGPDYLIEKDIILVTINYRVGILGFLNVEDVEAPGNQGLKDQVQALKWIQINISKFGGDPNNVTIFGESAGGASVHYLTLSPLSQGLFHKAIIQSGVATNAWAHLPGEPIEQAKNLATLLNQDFSDVKAFINYLRTLDSHDLVKNGLKIRTLKDKILFNNSFIPSLDLNAKNPFLTIPLTEAIKYGVNVPCICGYLSHEGLMSAGRKHKVYDLINADLENLLIHPTPLRLLNENNLSVTDVKEFYFDNEKISKNNINKIVDLYTAIYFRIDIENIIEIQSKNSYNPLYIYKFEYELNESIMKIFYHTTLKGTCHGDELGFLFHSKIGKSMENQLPTLDSTEYRLIKIFTEIWTNFAKIGNPTPQKTDLIPVMWQPIDNSNEYNYLKINNNLTMNKEKKLIQQYIYNTIKKSHNHKL